MNAPVKLGIVGLGRWAKVLTRAGAASDKLAIVAGFSRSEEKRRAYRREFGIPAAPTLDAMLADPEIKGVIVSAPNEQHLPLARAVAQAGKHVYTEKPIANTLEDGLEIEALERRCGVTVTVGHSARLMAGVRLIRAAIERGDLGRVTFLEANFSNPRALALTPDDWRWYRAKTPGGPLSQIAIHQFDVLHYLGGEIAQVNATASRLSPAGAKVDDQSMTIVKFADGKLGYVGACWTSPGIFCVRAFGTEGLMHYEADLDAWDVPEKMHLASALYLQRGKAGYGRRETLQIPQSDMVRAEIELFAESCLSGKPSELTAENGIIAVATVNAALRSIDEGGRAVAVADMIAEARERRAGARAAQ